MILQNDDSVSKSENSGSDSGNPNFQIQPVYSHQETKIDYSMFDIDNNKLRRIVDANRNVLIYNSNWLYDIDFKFYFGKIYYQNISKTSLNWRYDYEYLMMVKLMGCRSY